MTVDVPSWAAEVAHALHDLVVRTRLEYVAP